MLIVVCAQVCGLRQRQWLPRALLFVCASLFALSAIAQSAPAEEDDDDADIEAPIQTTPEERASAAARLPTLNLSPSLLYDLLLSEIAIQRGSAASAARTYGDLARKTRDPRVARRAMEVAGYAQAPQLAIDAARLWHDTDPTSVGALQTLTALLIGQRRIDEAVPLIEKLLALGNPPAAESLMQLPRLLANNPDRAANLVAMRRLAAPYLHLPQAHYAVAQSAAAAENATQALQSVREAARLKPEWEAPALFEAQLLQRTDIAQAQARLATYLAVQPKSSDVRLAYARLLAIDEKNSQAVLQIRRLAEDFPERADVQYAGGLLAAQLVEYPLADTLLQRALQLGVRDPNAVRFTLGQIAEERKAYPDALGWYAQVSGGTQYVASRLRHAHVQVKQGNLEQARAFLRAAPGSEAQRIQLLIGEAQLLRDAQQHKEAFTLLGEALAAQPEQAELLYEHALVAERLERFDVLEANLKKLITARPDHAHALNALGYSYADRNLRLPEAKSLIERAVKLAPDDFYILDSLGWVYFRLGEIGKALQHLQRAFAGRPDGEIGAHLGEVLWVNGQRDEAKRIWQESLKISPENDTLKKTLQRFQP